MNIKYKVVIEQSRKSCFAPPGYTKTYKKGAKVKAKKGTLGLMVFKTRKQAEDFIFPQSYDLQIIRVECFTRGRKPIRVAGINYKILARVKAFDSFYSIERYYYYLTVAPEGTLCYSEVRVID